MTESEGFKNAPGVTQFVQGMRVQGSGSVWYTVLHVGQKIILMDENGVADWCYPTEAYQFNLDLSVPWVGRRYMHRKNRVDVTVLMASDTRITFEKPLWGEVCWSREGFLQAFEPLPLPEPQSDGESEPPHVASDRIFSGPNSALLWKNINMATTMEDMRIALYSVCCNLQELESRIAALQPGKQ